MVEYSLVVTLELRIAFRGVTVETEKKLYENGLLSTDVNLRRESLDGWELGSEDTFFLSTANNAVAGEVQIFIQESCWFGR